MIIKYLRHTADSVITFLRNQSGSILIYTGAFMAVGMGGAALSIDIGRIVLLATQMQNRADAGALAGAAQLDAQDNARARATAIIEDSMTGYTTADEGSELAVWFAVFYDVDPDDPAKIAMGPESTTDSLARFARVVMQRRTISFFYGPALNIMTGNSGGNSTTLGSSAIAMSDPFICKMQPLMICDPFDDGLVLTDDDNIADDAYRGYGLRIKQGPQSGAWQPGNFGLLQLPDDGGNGAIAVLNALSAEEPLGCYATSSIETATGTPVQSVINGINVRWFGPLTAPNVMNYPRDDVMIADTSLSFGTDGLWDLDGYWTARHAGVSRPIILDGASRFQIYLFEQGQSFWKKGKKTSAAFSVDPPDQTGGWTLVDVVDYLPGGSEYNAIYDGMETVATEGHAIPVDVGDPDNSDVDGIPPDDLDISTKGFERRVLKIVVAKCKEEGFTGASELPADGVFLELFLTEQATEPSDGGEVYGELIRSITANTSLEFHGNVRLVQ